MEIFYYDEAIADLQFWKKSGNKIIQKKIEQLIIAIQENPFIGIGKPEALKHDLTGKWSRRINSEHRIVYQVINNIVHIYSLKGHYNL